MAEPDWDFAADLIAEEEGFLSYVYDDADGAWPRKRWKPGDPIHGTLTIGYGDTRPDLIERYMHTGITLGEALALLRERIVGYWEEGSKWFTVELNPRQAAIATSFFYNAGPAGMAKKAPDLLRAINERRWGDAARLWETAVLKRPQFDLSARRLREAELFWQASQDADAWHDLRLFVAVLVDAG